MDGAFASVVSEARAAAPVQCPLYFLIFIFLSDCDSRIMRLVFWVSSFFEI